MNPTNSEPKACPAPYVVGKAIESIEAQVRNGATTVHLTNECAQAVLAALRTRKSEALADELSEKVEGAIQWLEQMANCFKYNWPNTAKHCRLHVDILRAALSTLTPSPAVDLLRVVVRQEPKYRFEAGRVINRASGEAIPLDEPVMVFRARDIRAVEMLIFYQSICHNPEHRKIVGERIKDFERFRHLHPDRMKEPDTERIDAALKEAKDG